MQIIDVAAALIFHKGKLLITQRYETAHLGGLWEFPGGKRERGETFEECLVRELREELGIQVSVSELVESITHSYPERTVHIRFFRCELAGHEPQTLGCSALAWVAPAALDGFTFPAADAQVLQVLKQKPELWLPRQTLES